MTRDSESFDRRRFLQLVAAVPAGLATGRSVRFIERFVAADALFASMVASASAPKTPQTPTPECGDDDEPTPAETAGPFFKPRSPLRRSLIEPGTRGVRIVVTGRVFTRDCHPVPNALLDFWHADDAGHYDNAGFKLRGHQLSAEDGSYRLETVVPGLYPGRTRHIHVRVQPREGAVLTTQLYFPGEARNREDGLYLPDLLMSVRKEGSVRQGRFHFMLDTA
jgi:protocatechuate 3,4-dioxygenase beta subunit